MERLIGLAAVAVLLTGCGSSEPAETSAAGDSQAKVAASSWSPDMIKKFQEAHVRSRNGQDK